MSRSHFRATALATGLAASLATWFPGSAWSYEGRVVHLQGEVRQVGPRTGEVHTGSVYPAGARIRTAPEAILIVETSEGARLKVKGDSEIEIGDGAHPGARLHRGGVFARIPKLKGLRPAYRIRSKAAVMGVRGTEFYTAYGSLDSEVWMCVREGEVEVQTEKPAANPVVVKAGEGVWIRPDGPPPEAKAYEWTRQLNWNQDPQAGALEDRTRPSSGYQNPIRYNYD
jgi:ferric-dicitrate binding protein FerR (iron transport regulator)